MAPRPRTPHAVVSSPGLFVTPEPSSPAVSIDEEAEYDTGDGAGSAASAETDDEEDNEQTYHQLQEELPNHAAFDADLPQLVKRSTAMACKLYQKLGNEYESVEYVQNMAAKARCAQQCPSPKKPLIMLLGDTGTGKSSTTNSFLDISEATKAANAGTSCTCCPTFIVSELPGQERNCSAKIVFFDSDTQKNFLTEQLGNYNRFNFEHDPTWPDEQVQEYKALANTAAKILRALFCDQEEFLNPGRMAATMETAFHEDSPQSMINSMMGWCDDLLAEHGWENDRACRDFAADTIEELNDLVNPHIFESGEFDEPALWPLIEHVTKALRGSRVLEHIEILDLPGLSDTNRVRGEIAHKFIQKCDALWVVTLVARAISDSHVDRYLATYGERFEDRVAVIVTHSEGGVDEQLKNEMVRRRQSIGDWSCHQQQIVELQKDIASIDRRLKSRGKKRQRTMTEVEENHYRRRKDKLEDELSEARNSQFEGLVETRNAYITREVAEAYQKHLSPGSKLQVFCISNTHYEALKGRPSGDSRQLSAGGTGIPSLRNYALNLAAPAEFGTKFAYIHHVSVLAKGAAMWADANSANRDDAMLRVIGEPSQLWDTSIDLYIERVKRLVKESLVKSLKLGRASFVQAAMAVYCDIDTWHASTIRAFFNKNGAHRTRAQPFQRWNERFTERQTESIQSCWGAIISGQSALSQAAGKVMKQLEEIPGELNKHPASVPLEIKQFEALIHGYTVTIDEATKTRKRELSKKMKNIKLNASRDVPTGYFTQAMLPMYQEASTIKGDGCTAAMQCRLKDTLEGDDSVSPFKAVVKGVKDDLNDAANVVARNLQSDVKGILNQQNEQFVSILRKKHESSAEARTKRRLGLFLAGADRELDDVLTDLKRIAGRDEDG